MSQLRYVALLRGITNMRMKPFRDAMEELGFTDVESFATSGNLLFNARGGNPASLERRIAARFHTAAFVRTRTEMARVVAQDPLGAMVMFLAHPPAPATKRAFLDLDVQAPQPVLRGRTLYFSFPLLLRGRRTPLISSVRWTSRVRSVPRAWRRRCSLACQIDRKDIDELRSQGSRTTMTGAVPSEDMPSGQIQGGAARSFSDAIDWGGATHKHRLLAA